MFICLSSSPSADLWCAVISDKRSPQQDAVLGRDSRGKSRATSSTASRYCSPPSWISLIKRQANLAQTSGWAKAVMLLLVPRKSHREAVWVSLHGILSCCRYPQAAVRWHGKGAPSGTWLGGKTKTDSSFPNCNLWWEDSKNPLHLTSLTVLQLAWFECPGRLLPPPPLTFIAHRHGHIETHRVWFLCPPPSKADSPGPATIFCFVPPLTYMSSAASVGSAFAASFQVTALALKARSLHLQNLDTVRFETATVSICCWQPDPQLTAKQADPSPSCHMHVLVLTIKAQVPSPSPFKNVIAATRKSLFLPISAAHWTSARHPCLLLPK